MSFEEAMQKLEQNLAKQINNATADMKSHFDKKFEALEQRIAEVETSTSVNKNNISTVVITANNALNEAKENTGTIAKLQTEVDHLSEFEKRAESQLAKLVETVDVLSVRSNIAEVRLEEQTNRSLRKTLVIRGVKERANEKSWEETRGVAVDALVSVTKMEWEYLNKEIERVHRGKVVEDEDKLFGKRNIYILFYDWNISSEVLDNFRKHGKSTGIFIDQMYGPDTSYRRNQAIKYRKTLFEQEKIAHGFVDYPAKLMVKVNGQKGYRLEKDFSHIPIPMEHRQRTR